MKPIAAAELAERRERLLDHVVAYFTGFCFLATERPVAFAVNVAGDMAAFVPEFEVERVRAETSFERVES